jgi:cell division protein FtsA
MVAGRSGLIAALDVGASKVCCFIAILEGDGGLRIIGIGHQVSHGMRAGAVVDMEALEASVRAAVDAAERMAGEPVRDVVIGLSGGAPRSFTRSVEVAIAGHQVDEADIHSALEEARRDCAPFECEVIHCRPASFAIDGSRGVKDPRGMYGDRLGVDVHIVTAATAPVRNLENCIRRGHLGVAGMALTPYASGRACLVEDEMDLGVTLIDMGGGTTSVAVFLHGAMVFADVLPVGGAHVTKDIARGLLAPPAEAERIKTLYGSAIASPSDDREMITVPQLGESGEEEGTRISRSMLVGIIRPRLEETFELVRERLVDSGFFSAAGRRVVLTGGASQLHGAADLAGRILDKQIRIGRPLRLKGLAEATAGPAFSACAGLLALAGEERRQGGSPEAEIAPSAKRFSRVTRWFKENF